jgi:hypothetical protein
MTPKEKAQELVKKFTAHSYHNDNVQQCFDHAKQCALIAVEEILKAVNNPDETYLMKDDVNYWTEVKKEIEAL